MHAQILEICVSASHVTSTVYHVKVTASGQRQVQKRYKLKRKLIHKANVNLKLKEV